MKILITGASGFIGQHLCQYILSLNHTIHAVSRYPQTDDTPIIWHQIDLANPESLHHLLTQIQPDLIYHLAGLTRGSLPELMTANVLHSEYLFTAVAQTCPQARLLVLGSAASYGFVTPNETPIPETAPLRPLSPYGLSKATQDMLADQYARRYNLQIIRGRLFNVTGPGEPPTQVIAAIAQKLIHCEQTNQSTLKTGNLQAYRDFLHVRTAAQLIYQLGLQGTIREVYNICSGQATQIETLINILIKGATHPITLAPEPKTQQLSWDVPISVGDPSKIQKLTASLPPNLSLVTAVEQVLLEWRHKMKDNFT
ncbi:MAG TPA: NAD-dependent epimerase/dehydratase family protein [Anaerolineae bacterium]|nr:NAD-dependent epimerase/dehydratase family protein [Anaerolineae bacterium]